MILAQCRRWLRYAAVLAAALPLTAVAAECPNGFPSGPITMQVGYSAGGGTDTVARKVAAQLEEMTGWTIVVENKPGASGGVMATGLMHKKGDGRTIGVGTSTTLAIAPYDKPDIKYTYKDFRYIGTGMLLNYGLVALKEKPYETLEQFVDWVRKNGRGTVSVGSVSYEIAVKTLAKHYGIKLVPIPTKGSSGALKEALGNHVDATVQGAAHVPQIRAGKMVQLSTLTSRRASYAPDTKTAMESGVDFAMDGHIIFFLPKNTPDDIHTCLSQALTEVTGSEKYKKLMADLETIASNLGPDGTIEFLDERSAFYKKALSK